MLEIGGYPFYFSICLRKLGIDLTRSVHFQGDTLVVYTVGFNEKTFVDATGGPHTDEMTTMEGIRGISPTELEDRDWQASFVYKLRNDIRLEDYVCGEPHRDLASVAGLRRPWREIDRGLGITDHVWSIGELLDAALAVAIPAPTETASERRRRFRLIQGGKAQE
jgi:hypothetical protein